VPLKVTVQVFDLWWTVEGYNTYIVRLEVVKLLNGVKVILCHDVSPYSSED
jgi:hypothetical protein